MAPRPRSFRYAEPKESRLSERGNLGWIYLALMLVFVIPFLYVLIVRPVLYNGWRHFYFIYPVIVCWSVIGLHALLGAAVKKEVKYAGISALMIVFVYLAVWIGKNHPYEYVYYTRENGKQE